MAKADTMMDNFRCAFFIGLLGLMLVILPGVSLGQTNGGNGAADHVDAPNDDDSRTTPSQDGGGQTDAEIAPTNEGSKITPNHDGGGWTDQAGAPSDDGSKITSDQDGSFPTGMPVEVLQSGHGFALRGNDSFLLWLKVESLMPLEVSQIQGLLESNKSLEEIRDDIQQQEGNIVYRVSVILDHVIYLLSDIQLETIDKNSTSLRADLADGEDSSNSSRTDTQGNISVLISPSEGGMIGKGEMDLAAGPQAGKYTLLLDMEQDRHGKKMDR